LASRSGLSTVTPPLVATIPVESPADTAYLTAWFRALETARPDACFSDPDARMLAGERGPEVSQRLPDAALTASSCVVRTCIMDEFIMQLVKEGDIETVVNLGAGLDMRPYRLPLPRSLHWIEVDDADLLNYKASKLRDREPVCRVEMATLDITDAAARRSLLDHVGETANRALVLTEGLLIYLTCQQVTSLASDLHERPSLKWWLTDIVSPIALGLMNRHMSGGDGPRLQFAPQDRLEFFQGHGWDAMELRGYEEESLRLSRWALPQELLVTHLFGWPWVRQDWLHAVVKLERHH
jgi:methyltransferase (TIGR00027 family)